mgnify:FL=1
MPFVNHHIPLSELWIGICKLVITLYDLTVCIHGTSMNNLDSILRSGLKRMGRNHVHFATGLPTEDGVISGNYNKVKSKVHIEIKLN